MAYQLAVKKKKELLRGVHMHKFELDNAKWKAGLKKFPFV